MLRKLLIIEDSPVEADMLKELFEEKGDLEVGTANSGEEGIAKALEMEPDLIIVDLMLPGISGFEVCSRIKKEPSLTKTIVVVLSIKEDLQDINKAFHCGADDYVTKPSAPDFLVRKIRLYLGLR